MIRSRFAPRSPAGLFDGAVHHRARLHRQPLPARGMLFFCRHDGGMFIVPVNAALQELGQLSIGSGAAVALQGFFQNLTMLLAVGGYTYAASRNADPVMAVLVLGGLVFVATFLVSLHLPDNQMNPFKNRR